MDVAGGGGGECVENCSLLFTSFNAPLAFDNG